MAQSVDVVIAGGGIVGSAVAYFLAAQPGFGGRIVVVERDSSYRTAATSLSASSIRQQFSTPINIAMSQFAFEFLGRLEHYLAVDGEPLDVGFVKRGYLFLATRDGLEILAGNIRVQRAAGVAVDLLTPQLLKERFPWLDVVGLAGGATTRTGEGWFDAYALLQAFRRKARSLGVEYRSGEVLDLQAAGETNVKIRLRSGDSIGARWGVIAAGTGAPGLAANSGFSIPVVPRKRCVFVFKCRKSLPLCPLVIDPSGLYFRPEGDRFICGLPPPRDTPVGLDDFEVDHALFDELIWPLLARRVPAFAAISLVGAWAGHYDYNDFDQNAFVGPLPHAPRLLIASGFSGHGLQQAPAVGRGLAEWIVRGKYTSLDLSPLSCERMARAQPLVETNVI